jgi:hypothetical protein
MTVIRLFLVAVWRLSTSGGRNHVFERVEKTVHCMRDVGQVICVMHDAWM